MNGVTTKKKDEQNKWDDLLHKQLNINVLLTQGLHQEEGNNDFFIR